MAAGGSLLTELKQLYDDGKQLCDFTLHCGEDAEVTCHTLVAAANSTMIEQQVKNGVYSLEIDSKTKKKIDLNSLALYFYTGNIEMDANNVLVYMVTGENLGIADLKWRAAEKLQTLITHKNWMKLYTAISLHESPESVEIVKTLCAQFLATNLKLISEETFYKDVEFRALLEALDDRRVNAHSEDDVLKAVLEWLQLNKGTLSPEDLNESAIELFDAVCFADCTQSTLHALLPVARAISKDIRMEYLEKCLTNTLMVGSRQSAQVSQLQTRRPEKAEPYTHYRAQPHNIRIITEIERFYHEKFATNITLKTTDQEHRDCHKYALGAKSAEFKALLMSKLGHDDLMCIDVAVTSNVLDILLNLTYFDEYSDKWDTYAKELVEANVFWKLPGLSDECFKALSKTISLENMVSLSALACEIPGSSVLRADTEFYMRQNFRALLSLKMGDIKKLTFEALSAVLDSPHLNVSNEEMVFECIRLWMDVHSDHVAAHTLLQYWRYKEVSKQFVQHVIKADRLFDHPPNGYCKNYRNILVDHIVEDYAPEVSSTSRKWKRLVQLNNGYLEVFNEQCKQFEKFLNFPTGVYHSVLQCQYSSGVVILGSKQRNQSISGLLLDVKNECVHELPELKTRSSLIAVVANCNTNNSDDEFVYALLSNSRGSTISLEFHAVQINLKNFDMLSRSLWVKRGSPSMSVTAPLAVSHLGHVYLFGGKDSLGQSTKYVQRYHHASNQWMCFKASPAPLSSENDTTSIVVYNDVIRIIKVDCFFTYHHDTDRWKVVDHCCRIEGPLSSVDYNGRLLVVSRVDGKYVILQGEVTTSLKLTPDLLITKKGREFQNLFTI